MLTGCQGGLPENVTVTQKDLLGRTKDVGRKPVDRKYANTALSIFKVMVEIIEGCL